MSKSELHDWECEIKELSSNNADKMLGIARDIYKTAFVRGRNSMTWEQTRWIPVSERLPDDRKDCIVTFKDGYVDTMCYAPDLYKVDNYDFYAKKGKAGWYDYDSEWGYYSKDDVIAWMPLPEPYKEESEGKE